RATTLDGHELRLNEASVRRDTERRVTLEHLTVQVGVDLDGVRLDEVADRGIVALRLDALQLAQELAEELAQRRVIVDDEVRLAGARAPLDDVVGPAVLVRPRGDELAVTHVVFLDALSGLDAEELLLQAIPDVAIVLGVADVDRRQEPELDELRIDHEVQRNEIGARLLERRAVIPEGLGYRADAGLELARGVAD